MSRTPGVLQRELVRLAPRTLLMLAALTLIWGTNWPLFPLAVREVSVWTFRASSGLIAALTLFALARWIRLPLALPRAAWLPVGMSALFYMTLWNVAATQAASLIPSGQAAILGFTMPLWAALITWAVFGERLSRHMLVAVLLGAAAVTLLIRPGFASFAQAPLGFGLGLLSGLGWAVGTLILKRSALDRQSILVLTAWQLLLSTLPTALGAVLIGDGQWFVPSWTTVVVIAYIALVPTCLGNWCWFSIVAAVPANVAGLVSILVPVVAMLSGAVVHDEPLGAVQWLSMLCCASALWLALVKPARMS